MSATLGWKCHACTFQHSAPGTRCVMCQTLRVSKQQMRDFIQGKTLQKKDNAAAAASKDTNHNGTTAKENQPPMTSLPSSRTTSTTTTAATVVRNPYARKNPPSSVPQSSMRTASPATNPYAKTAAALVSSTTTTAARGTAVPHPRAPPSRPVATTTTACKPPALPSSSCTKPPDLWARSIRPPPPTYQPGPVPLCPETAHHWIYPIHKDFPIRDYQLEMTTTALFHNTLVSLPTGLGKTLIAAVVLYNYYRWFPTGKILFLAPTLPLVNQQVKACFDVMGIPEADTALLTGKSHAKERAHFWKERRVFFCTPQTVQKDIEMGRCPAAHVVCCVLDEAHKASGNYAYTQVVDLLFQKKAKFRIVGLSATPGGDLKAVQRVVDALHISKIEARLDDDPDVKQYIHERHSELIVVPQASAVTTIERLLTNLIAPVLEGLRKAHALTYVRGNATLTSYCLIKARNDYHSRTNDRRLDCHFLTAQKLVDLRSHLNRTGIGMVRSKMLAIQNGESRGLLTSVVKGPDFQRVLAAVMTAASNGNNATTHNDTAQDVKLNNPKLLKLDEILREHFERSKACDAGESSRAIVFSQWRESVSEIVHVLSAGQPLLRPRQFVGQGKSSGGAKRQTKKGAAAAAGAVDASRKGMKQSEQQGAIKDFHDGIYNILVCTSIGEEGLDIGQVDLIVNYDTLRSPIRMIQRVGRTGRKRSGRVVCLIAEGQEEKTMRSSKMAEKTLGRALKKPDKFKLTPNVPMFPTKPQLEKKDMSVSAVTFRLSQVGGNGPPVRRETGECKKNGDLVDPAVDWRLTAAQEARRSTMFGDLDFVTCPEMKSTKGRLPGALQRRFLRGRTRACTSHDDSYGFGSTRKILFDMERRHGKTSRRRLRSTGRAIRERGVMQQVFPLENAPARTRPSLSAWKPPVSTEPDTREEPYGGTSSETRNPLRPMPQEANISVAEHNSESASLSLGVDAVGRSAHVANRLDADKPAAGTELSSERPSFDRPVELPRNPNASVLADSINHVSRPLDVDVQVVIPGSKVHNSDFVSERPKVFQPAVEAEPQAEFLLPTPPDSSSSEESEAESECEVEERGQESGTEQVDHAAAVSTIAETAPAVPQAKSDVSPVVQNEDRASGVPLESFRLPTQESSSEDESGDEGDDEDDASMSSPKLGSPSAENTACSKEEQHRADSPTAKNNVTLKLKSSTDIVPPCDARFPEEDACDLVDTPDSPSDPETPDPTPTLHAKKTRNEKTNVFMTQEPSRHSPTFAASADLHRASQSEKTPRSSSTSDCLVDTPSADSHHPSVSEKTPKTNCIIDCLVDTPSQGEMTPKPSSTVNCLVDTPSQSEKTPKPSSTIDCLVDTPTSIARECPVASVGREPLDDDSCGDMVCAVCFSGESTDEDPIALCDGPNNDYSCNLAVHKSCYSITEDLDKLDHWQCQPCSLVQTRKQDGVTKNATRCCVCQKKGGALRRLSDSHMAEWVHPYCAPFRNSTDKLDCQVCSSPGASICSADGCYASAHSHCALSLSSKWIVVMGTIFCNNHEADARALLQAAGDGRFNARQLPRYILLGGSQSSSASLFAEAANDGSNVETEEVPKRKRLKKITNETKPATRRQMPPPRPKRPPTSPEKVDDSAMKRQRIRERMQERHQGMLRNQFIASEADIDSVENADGDESEDALRRIEEEEAFYNDFINDSSQLGHATQDDLDRHDPTSTTVNNLSASMHRAFDAEKARSHQFATPIFNRRQRQGPDEPTPSSAPSDQKGLGNMHFIRSVLEHHRNGGEADDLEAAYHQMAPSQASPVIPPPDPSGPLLMNYEASDSEDSDEEEERKLPARSISAASTTVARPPPVPTAPVATGLSEEQKALIEAKRQEALRRRQKLNRG